MSELSTSFYVILSGRKSGYGWRDLRPERIVKRTSSLPKTGRDEVAIRVNVTVPKALFERPELTVSINVAGDTPRVDVDAETMDTMAERMQELIGVPVHITCDLPGEGE